MHLACIVLQYTRYCSHQVYIHLLSIAIFNTLPLVGWSKYISLYSRYIYQVLQMYGRVPCSAVQWLPVQYRVHCTGRCQVVTVVQCVSELQSLYWSCAELCCCFTLCKYIHHTKRFVTHQTNTVTWHITSISTNCSISRNMPSSSSSDDGYVT